MSETTAMKSVPARRRGWILALTALLATTIGSAVVAPAADAAVAPRYRIEAMSFKAADESGWDGAWYAPVSDEPYWIYSSVGADGSATTRKSHTFSDVDSGETRNFSSSERCMFGTVSNGVCLGRSAPNGIGVSVQLWEADNGSASSTMAKTGEWFKKAGDLGDYLPGSYKWMAKAAGYVGTACNIISGWLKDDLLGTRTLEYSKTSLQHRLPVKGQSFTETRYFGGLGSSNGADYYLKLRVTRTV